MWREDGKTGSSRENEAFWSSSLARGASRVGLMSGGSYLRRGDVDLSTTRLIG